MAVSMKILRKLVTGVYKILNSISEWPGFLAILAMGASVIIGVIARYAFGYPLLFVEEYNGYLNALVIVLPLAWVLRHSEHIRINLVVKALPQRAANYLDMATILVSLGVIILLIIGTTQLVMTSFASGRQAWSALETPLAPVQLIVPIGLGLFAIQIMVDIAKRVKAWGTPHERIISN